MSGYLFKKQSVLQKHIQTWFEILLNVDRYEKLGLLLLKRISGILFERV